MNRNTARLRTAMQRRLQALTPAIDRALDSDRAFFVLHASRSYRLRRASRPEIEALQVFDGPHSRKLSDDLAWFVAVRQIVPGIRVRTFGAIAPHGGDDPPEAVCRTFYEAWAATPSIAELEQRLATFPFRGCRE